MKNKHIKAGLNILAALSAFIAAVLWYKASVVVVRPSGRADRDGWETQIMVSHESTGEFDPFATGISQSKWNKWAATAAAVSAAIQGIVLLLPD